MSLIASIMSRLNNLTKADEPTDVAKPSNVFKPENDKDLSPEERSRKSADTWTNTMMERLSTFDTESHADFIQPLLKVVIKKGIEIDEINRNAWLEDEANNLKSMAAKIKGEEFLKVPTTTDNRTVDDLLQNYITENTRSLDSFFDNIYSKIEDGNKYVVTSDDMYSSKAKKKIKNAEKAYAHHPCDDYFFGSIDGFLVLFDTTLWGSGDEGIVFSDQFIAFKSMLKDPVYISNIKSISIDSDDKEIYINDECYHYVHSELNRAARLSVEAYRGYIEQPTLALRKHLNNHPLERKEVA